MSPESAPRRRDRVEAWFLVVLAVVALVVVVLRGQPVRVTDVVHPAPTAWTITLPVLIGLLALAVASTRPGQLLDERFRAVRPRVAVALVAEIVLVVLAPRAVAIALAVVVGTVALAGAAARIVPTGSAPVPLRWTLFGPISFALGWTATLTPAAGELVGGTLGWGPSAELAWLALIVLAVSGAWVVERVRAPLPFVLAFAWGLLWMLPGGPEWIVTPVLLAVLVAVWTLVRRLTRGGPPNWAGAFG